MVCFKIRVALEVESRWLPLSQFAQRIENPEDPVQEVILGEVKNAEDAVEEVILAVMKILLWEEERALVSKMDEYHNNLS